MEKQTKKLTSWKNEPKIEDLRHDLEEALPYYSEHTSKISNWLSLLNVKNDVERNKRGRSGIAVKTIRKMYEWRYASLASPFLVEKNLFKVQPKTKNDVEASIQNQLILNDQFSNKINKVKLINDLVRTLVNEGTAIIRTGWDYQAGEYTVYQPVYKYRSPKPEEEQLILLEIGKVLQEQGFTEEQLADQMNQQLGSDPNALQMLQGSENPLDPRTSQLLSNRAASYVDGDMPQEDYDKFRNIGQGMEDGNFQSLTNAATEDAYDEHYANYQQAFDEESQALENPLAEAQMQQQAMQEASMPQEPQIDPQVQAWKEASEKIRTLNELAKKKGKDPIFTEMDNETLQRSIEESMDRGKVVIAEKTKKTKPVKEIRVEVNKPVVEVMNNFDVIFDPTCNGDVNKAKFIIYKFETCYADLKANEEIYTHVDDLLDEDNEIKSNVLEMSDRDFHQYRTSQFRFKDKSRKRFTAYEYWGYYDIDDSGLLQPIVVTFVDDVIIRMEVSPFPDKKLPFTVIQYMPVSNSIYGEPDAELIEDNQRIITMLTRSIIDITAKTATAQTSYPKGFLDVVNKTRFFNGENYEYNPVSGMHPSQAVYTHNVQELPNSVFSFLNQQIQDVESATGIKSYSHGIDQTAYGQNIGARFSLANLTQRESDILYRVSSALSEVGNKVISMNGKWLEEENAVQLTGYEFITIPKDALDGTFNVRVDVSSTTENFTQAQNLSFLLQTLGNTVDFEVTRPLLVKLASLYHMDDVAMSIQQYAPEPDPVQQELMQLQVEKAKKEIEKISSDISSAQAEAEYFAARSAYIQALADNEDLKYIRSGDGIDHEEKKDIIREEANAKALAQIARSRDPDIDPADQKRAAKAIVDKETNEQQLPQRTAANTRPPIPTNNSLTSTSNPLRTGQKVNPEPRPRLPPIGDNPPNPLNNLNRKLGLT